MPPALSDSASSDGESVTPIRETRQSTNRAPPGDSPDEGDINARHDSADEGSEADDLDDDVFIVEAIKKHIIDEDGTLKFQVKWEGYESRKDLTWEPEENLEESAADILNEYLAAHGGRDGIFDDTDRAGRKKRRRTTNGTPGGASKRTRKSSTHPIETTPPVTFRPWAPPAGSWEDEIETIDACEDEGSGKLVVYLIWKNGQKTKHDTGTIYKKCPQKMLHFYERHVKIIPAEPRVPGEGGTA